MDDGSVTEQCAKCSAPLADDQRYCLQCGEPRAHVGGPPSRTHTTAQAPSVPPGPAAPPGTVLPTIPAPQGGRNNSLALLAGVGVLLLAMGVGVLIGRAGAGSSKAAPAQVISVGGTAGDGVNTGVGGSTTPAPTTTPETPAGTAPAKKEAPKSKGSSSTGSSSAEPTPPSASKLKHSSEGAQSYEQKSKNLPDEVGT